MTSVPGELFGTVRGRELSDSPYQLQPLNTDKMPRNRGTGGRVQNGKKKATRRAGLVDWARVRPTKHTNSCVVCPLLCNYGMPRTLSSMAINTRTKRKLEPQREWRGSAPIVTMLRVVALMFSQVNLEQT